MYSARLRIWKFIINVGISTDLPFDVQKRLRILNQILFLGIFIPLTYAILFAILGYKGLMLLEIEICAISIATFALNAKLKKNVGKVILLLVIPLQMLVFPLFIADIGVEYFFFLFIIIGFYVIDNRYYLAILSTFLLVMLLLTRYLVSTIEYPPEYQVLEELCYYPNLIISILLVTFSTALFKFDTEVYKSTIRSQADELEQKLKELEDREKLAGRLLKELNHRVKNNLQMISGLFTMQSYSYNNQEVVRAFTEARNRIDAIAILHQHLYKSDFTHTVELSGYIKKLSNYILQASGMENKVDLNIKCDELKYKIEIATHIALIVNELLTNAFKYGVNPLLNSNNIYIGIKKAGNLLLIEVVDKGGGFPDDFSLKGNDSFGLGLVDSIAQQYNGLMRIENLGGAKVWVYLKLEH